MRNITKPHKGNYLKHALLVTGIAIPILLIFIFLFVVPFGSEYKHIKRDSKVVERDLKQRELHYNERLNTLQRAELEHSNLLKTLETPKSLDEFKDENPFISKILSLQDRWEDGKLFRKEVYQIDTKYLYTTLNNFYDMLKHSDDFGFRFVLDFPIVFEADKGKIKSSFAMSLYKLKPIDRELVRPFKDIQK